MIFPFLRRIAYTSRKLAIIGNGFDLAHGLKTSCYDFVCAQKEGTFKNYNDFLKRYGNGSQHWYSFEERIDEISMQCFQCLYDDQYDYNEVLHDTDQINQLFKDIKGHLLKYLRNEVSGRKIKRKLSICKAVRKSTFAINFNYTDTAELYTKNVLYVHGSLKENEIVLGYDFREEPCFIEYKMQIWSKALCRERLEFSRFLKKRYKLFSEQQQYHECMADIEKMQKALTSGQGFTDWKNFYHPAIISEFYKGNPYRQADSFDMINPRKIKTIIVLGHSLFSDKQYLEALLNECVNLRKVIIFTYDGENENSIQRKKAFFQRFCRKVITCSY